MSTRHLLAGLSCMFALAGCARGRDMASLPIAAMVLVAIAGAGLIWAGESVKD